MTRDGPTKGWILGGIVAFALILVAVILQVQARTRATADKIAGRGGSDSAESVAMTVDSTTTPSGRTADVASATAAATAGKSATGRLHIRVRDALTDRPVPDATCVVYSERGGSKEHGVVRTDADGRASLGDLPENDILVHVLRQPPHASAYGGVALHAGETRNLEIALTAGGTVFGRAVDETGKAVADAEVFFSSDRAVSPMDRDVEKDSGLRTDADGRFEIAHVVSSPWKVWIADGQFRPEHWLDVGVRVRSALSEGRTRAQVTDGARVDLGDIVVPAGRSYAGRVLDAHRAPVAGALVDLTRWFESTNWTAKSTRVELKDVALHAGQAITLPDGSFHVQMGEPAKYASVTTAEGIFEQFAVPESSPLDLELVLKDWSILEIGLVDDNGAPATRSSPAFGDKRIRMASAARQIASSAGQLDATLVIDDKREIHAMLAADADGLFRFQTSGTSGMSRRLHLVLSGYQPVDELIGAQTTFVERRRFTLHALPTMKVHVSIAAQPPSRRPDDRLSVIVQACLLDPAQVKERIKYLGTGCCGQGSIWTAPLEQGEHDIVLPVLAAGRYWLHAYVPSARVGENGEMENWVAFEEHHGPFQADDAAHELKVPAVDPLPVQEDKRGPPPESLPTSETLRFRIVDAATMQGIQNVSVGIHDVPKRPLGSRTASTDKEGRPRKMLLRPGAYVLEIFPKGYRRPKPIEFTIDEGQVRDLGAIALEPLTTTTLRLREADDRPVPRGARVELWGPSGFSDGLVQTRVASDDGTIVLQSELGNGFTILVDEPRPGSDIDGMHGCQWIAHDFVPTETEVVLRLLKWQPIEVRVGGAIQEFAAATLTVITASNVDRWGTYRLTEVLALPDGTRRFRGEVGGPLQLPIAVKSTLLQPLVQRVDIEERAGLQTFLVTSAR